MFMILMGSVIYNYHILFRVIWHAAYYLPEERYCCSRRISRTTIPFRGIFPPPKEREISTLTSVEDNINRIMKYIKQNRKLVANIRQPRLQISLTSSVAKWLGHWLRVWEARVRFPAESSQRF